MISFSNTIHLPLIHRNSMAMVQLFARNTRLSVKEVATNGDQLAVAVEMNMHCENLVQKYVQWVAEKQFGMKYIFSFKWEMKWYKRHVAIHGICSIFPGFLDWKASALSSSCHRSPEWISDWYQQTTCILTNILSKINKYWTFYYYFAILIFLVIMCSLRFKTIFDNPRMIISPVLTL